MEIQEQGTMAEQCNKLPCPENKWVAQLLVWYKKEQRDFPWRRELNVYNTWVCEVMSQQTSLTAVLPKYLEFIAQLPTLESLSQCSEPKLRQLWAGLGYYARARNLQKGANFLLQQYNGLFPSKYEEWLRVPGCGPYTAAAISSICFSYPVACVDGNVVRVVSRLLGLGSEVWEASGQNKIRKFVNEFLPKNAPGDFNQAMMEMGAVVCKKKQPLCHICPIQFSCIAYAKGIVATCPPNKPRRDFVNEKIYGFVLHNSAQSSVALFHRSKGFLAKTIGLPLIVDSTLQCLDFLTWNKKNSFVTLSEVSKSITHTITHHRILGTVWSIDVSTLPTGTLVKWLDELSKQLKIAEKPQWVSQKDVQNALSSSFDKKLWQLFADFSGRQNL